MPPQQSPVPTVTDQGGEGPAAAALAEHCRELLVLIGEDGETRQVGAATGMLGYPPEERVGRHVGEFVHPDDLHRILDLLERGRSTPGLRESVEVRARHHAGHWVLLTVEACDARDDPRLGGFVLRVTDSIATSADGGGAAEPSQFQSLAELVPFGILSADRRGWVVYANEAATELFWRTPAQLAGSGWLQSIHPEDRSVVEDAFAAALGSSARPTVTFRLETHGQLRWVAGRFNALHGDAGAAGWVATFHDVTAVREAEAELSHLATHDTLTGLPNRALLEDRLEQALARLHRERGSVTVFFLDLNDFKPINDLHGHAFGDAVLVRIANRIRSALRSTDTAARFGGDEFLVVSEGLSPDEAWALSRRLSEIVRAPMTVDGVVTMVACCIGVSRTVDPNHSSVHLVSLADAAMYRAKRAGTAIELSFEAPHPT